MGFLSYHSGDARRGTRPDLPAESDPVRFKSQTLFWENMEESTTEIEKQQDLL